MVLLTVEATTTFILLEKFRKRHYNMFLNLICIFAVSLRNNWTTTIQCPNNFVPLKRKNWTFLLKLTTWRPNWTTTSVLARTWRKSTTSSPRKFTIYLSNWRRKENTIGLETLNISLYCLYRHYKRLLTRLFQFTWTLLLIFDFLSEDREMLETT